MKIDFEKFLFEDLGVNSSDKILLAVSGGMDSMFLWHLFRESKLNYIIAHCNFKLRSDESDADEEFVKSFANSNEEVFCTSFETSSYAEQNSISIQMAARELRYDWFKKLKEEQGCDFIATAHHLDDQIETFFIQLLRKKSQPGPSGMPVKTDEIIRPLMFLGRESIEDFMMRNKIPWREDSSNRSDSYLRNRIRKNLIPVLQKTAPGFKNSLLEVMSNLNEISADFKKYVERKTELLFRNEGEDIRIDIHDLMELDFPQLFLEQALRKYGFNKDQVRNVLESIDSQSGRIFYSPEYRLFRDRNDFILTSHQSEKELIFKFELNDLLNENSFFVRAFKTLKEESKLDFSDPLHAYLDISTLSKEIEFRKWREGDRFTPFGMKGSKKLSDYFIDKKFSLPEKERQWVMTSGGKICWLVGRCIDDSFKIRENTEQVLNLELQYI